MASRSPSVMSGSDHSESAGRTLTVPHDRIVGIEHPCIIRDIDNAVRALGGEHHMKKILNENGFSATSLRPDDPFAKKLVSQKSDVDHVLLRIVLPRRTGRKRKRGTDEPYKFHDEQPQSSGLNGNSHLPDAGRDGTTSDDRTLPLKADALLGKLSAAGNSCTVQPVGTIHASHRFRSLPDFQHISQDSPLFQSMAASLLPLNLDSIKTFQPDFSVNASSDYISGPPRFAPYNQPLNYGYGQNRATITTVDDTGRFRSSNINIPRKRHQLAIRVEDAAPSAPPSALPSLTSCTRSLQNAVSTLTTLLRTRQVTTRRAALNLLPDMTEQLFKDATQYVGYAFKSGPWKDCHVLYGVDPRLDPLFRESQILVFQLEGKGKSSATGRYKRPEFRGGRDEGADHHGTKGRREEGRDHVFDGRYLGTNKTFQVRDIEEPIIRALFDVAPVMEECDEHDGWWGNGTMCVARSIMKDMIALIQKGEETGRWKVAYEVAAARMPAVLTEDNVDAAILDVGKLEDEGMTRELARKSVELVHAARAIARQGFKGVGKGRRGRGSTGRFIVGDRRTSTAASSSIGDASADGADMDEDEDMEGQDDEVADGNDGDALADLEAAEFIEE